MATTVSHPKQRSEDLLEPFIESLSSPRAITIPTETLLGAITHFLSTSPRGNAARLARAIVGSPTLWTAQRPARIREAISLAVQSKMGLLEARHDGAWLRRRRVSGAATRWLEAVLHDLHDDDLTISTAATHIRLGFLAGMSACKAALSSDVRIRLEDDVVIALGGTLAAARSADPGAAVQFLDMLGASLDVVDADRLRVLDIESLVPILQSAWRGSIDRHDDLSIDSVDTARSLGRVLDILAGGPGGLSGRVLALLDGCATSAFEAVPRLASQPAPSAKGKEREGDDALRQALLQTILLPLASIVDILLKARIGLEQSYEARRAVQALSQSMLLTLATLSRLSGARDGKSEEHDRVFYGSLDLVAAASDSVEIRQLFKSFLAVDESTSRDAFVLRCGEMLVNHLEGYTVIELLLPLCQKCLQNREDLPSFEAAHAFMLAIVSAACAHAERPLPQEAFATEVALYYSRMLLKHLKGDLISSDQFVASYLIVCELASKLEGDAVDHVTSALSSEVVPSDGISRTLLATSITVGQHIRRSRLRLHLDQIGTKIMALPTGEERLDLVAKLFTLVSQDLPDDRKSAGRSWWLEWKDRLLDRSDRLGPVKAKL